MLVRKGEMRPTARKRAFAKIKPISKQNQNKIVGCIFKGEMTFFVAEKKIFSKKGVFSTKNIFGARKIEIYLFNNYKFLWKNILQI